MKADDLDPVWKALSDPTRRAILDLLRQGPRTTTEIVDAFPHLTRFGVMKHIDVLREADIIETRQEGRQRIQAEIAFLFFLAVTLNAIVGQDRPDFCFEKLNGGW